MSQYILDCTSTACTIVPYSAPPATVEHYTFAANWVYLVAAVVVLAFIIAMAVVRLDAHEQRGITERKRIENPPKQCPTCGDRVS